MWRRYLYMAAPTYRRFISLLPLPCAGTSQLWPLPCAWLVLHGKRRNCALEQVSRLSWCTGPQGRQTWDKHPVYTFINVKAVSILLMQTTHTGMVDSFPSFFILWYSTASLRYLYNNMIKDVWGLPVCLGDTNSIYAVLPSRQASVHIKWPWRKRSTHKPSSRPIKLEWSQGNRYKRRH